MEQNRQEERVASQLQIRCYQAASMEELTVMQVEAVCRKTFFITGQIVAVIAGVLELSSA